MNEVNENEDEEELKRMLRIMGVEFGVCLVYDVL